jgi:predicted transcriptional regulator
MAKVQLTVLLEQEDREKLEQLAQEKELTLSNLMRIAIKEYLKNHEK